MKHLALGLLLLCSALFFSFKLYEVWNQDQASKSPAPPRAAAVAMGKPVTPRTQEPVTAYEPIVSSNLFAPARTEKVVVIAPPVPPVQTPSAPVVKEVKIAGQEITLYGTMTQGNFHLALINNPLKSASDKRLNRWIKVGDTLSNLVVEEIRHDQIVVREGSNRYIVLMRDPERPKSAAAKPAAASTTKSNPTVIPTDAGSETKMEPKAAEKAAGEPAQTTGNTEKKEGDEYIIVKGAFGPQRIKVKP